MTPAYDCEKKTFNADCFIYKIFLLACAVHCARYLRNKMRTKRLRRQLSFSLSLHYNSPFKSEQGIVNLFSKISTISDPSRREDVISGYKIIRLIQPIFPIMNIFFNIPIFDCFSSQYFLISREAMLI